MSRRWLTLSALFLTTVAQADTAKPALADAEYASAIKAIRPAKGVHITVPWSLVQNRIAVVIPVPKDRRSVFVVPWGGEGGACRRSLLMTGIWRAKPIRLAPTMTVPVAVIPPSSDRRGPGRPAPTTTVPEHGRCGCGPKSPAWWPV